jgi:hypothetical protein
VHPLAPPSRQNAPGSYPFVPTYTNRVPQYPVRESHHDHRPRSRAPPSVSSLSSPRPSAALSDIAHFSEDTREEGAPRYQSPWSDSDFEGGVFIGSDAEPNDGCYDEVDGYSNNESAFSDSAVPSNDSNDDAHSDAPSYDTVTTGCLVSVEDLSGRHQDAWNAARSCAHEITSEHVLTSGRTRTRMPRPSDEFFPRLPWSRYSRRLRSYHNYGVHDYDGSVNYGKLWARMYLCGYTNDYGLCYFTFGTPETCPMGSSCRWKHEIRWRDLRLLIITGRVSVPRAQIMMANWCTPNLPELNHHTIHRMMAILIGLGSGPDAQTLKPIRKWTVPYANYNS